MQQFFLYYSHSNNAQQTENKKKYSIIQKILTQHLLCPVPTADTAHTSGGSVTEKTVYLNRFAVKCQYTHKKKKHRQYKYKNDINKIKQHKLFFNPYRIRKCPYKIRHNRVIAFQEFTFNNFIYFFN